MMVLDGESRKASEDPSGAAELKAVMPLPTERNKY